MYVKGVSVFVCEHLPRGFSKAELGFCSKENQIPGVICSMTLGKLFQRVPVFTHFTLKALAMLPLHITPALTSSHFSVLLLQLESWWETRKKKEKTQNILNSRRAYSSVHHRCSWCRVGQNENCANSHNLTHTLSSIQKKVKLLKSIIAEEPSKIWINESALQGSWTLRAGQSKMPKTLVLALQVNLSKTTPKAHSAYEEQ